MKRRSSSSKGESRPVNGAPARAGRKSCAGRGSTTGNAEACEGVGRGDAAPTPRHCYVVRRYPEEQKQLLALVDTGGAAAAKGLQARLLLKLVTMLGP
jgi:hypothetical protein